MLTCHSFGWIICSHAWHASIILSLLLMPTHLCKISLSLSLSLPSFSISPFSLFTQECVICGSVDGVCNIPAEHRREGQTRERWWKTTPLPPRLMYPSSPRSLILWSSSSTNFYCLFPPCNQSHRQVRCTAKYANGLFFWPRVSAPETVLLRGNVFYHFIHEITLKLKRDVFLIYQKITKGRTSGNRDL